MNASPKRTRTLFRRVYLHGLLLLSLVTVALGTVGFLFGREARWRASPARLAHHAGGLLASVPDPALQAAVARLAAELDVSLAVYAEDGRLLASAGDRPPFPPQGPLRARAFRRHLGATSPAGPGRTLRLALHGAEADLVLRALGVLALVVLVVALVSAPLARAIARPIERLSQTARRLGEGDLKARTGLDRRDEIGELARAFDEMAARLERLVEGQRQLLADVSHELRTPLARIRVSLSLGAEANAADVPRRLRDIEEDVAALEALVGDLLTASRLDTGGARALRRERVDPRLLVEEAVERLSRLHPGRRVETTLESTPALDADPGLLSRVLDNLLDNATRYSEGAPVQVAVGPGEGGVTISVRDQGIGIAPEDQARLFTPFFRTDRSRARHTGGAGLGLLLSKRIVEAHGGRIGLESRPGEGTRVFVWLPAAPAA
jgi:signal transduction histidine kinase